MQSLIIGKQISNGCNSSEILSFESWLKIEVAANVDAANQRQKAEMSKQTVKISDQDSKSSSSSPEPSQVQASVPSSGSSTVVINDDEDIDAGSSRGYKQTADGRKTTYFNRDIDDEARNLIGDIAPKRLDPSNDVSASQCGAPTTSVSAWNSAGTWEARSVTTWAKDNLSDYLSVTKIDDQFCRVPKATNFKLHLEEVKDLQGEAEICFARGKKKVIFEFSFSILWKLVPQESQREINGCLVIHEVNGDNCCSDSTGCVPFLADASVTISSPNNLMAEEVNAVNELVRSNSQGLKGFVFQAVNKLVIGLREK